MKSKLESIRDTMYYNSLGSPINYNGVIYRYKVEHDEPWYEYGRHAIFLSAKTQKFGIKFYVVKNIQYGIDKINELFNIYNILHEGGWTVKALDVKSCLVNSVLHYGIVLENSGYTQSGKKEFDLSQFRSYCNSIPGLYKREFLYESRHGKDWYKKYPELTFFVGDNNLHLTQDGRTVLVDIDPRWGIKNLF